MNEGPGAAAETNTLWEQRLECKHNSKHIFVLLE